MSPDRPLFQRPEIDVFSPDAQEVQRILALVGQDPEIVDKLLSFASKAGRELRFWRAYAHHRLGAGFESSLVYDQEPGETPRSLFLEYTKGRTDERWSFCVANENVVVHLQEPFSFEVDEDGNLLIRQVSGPVLIISASLTVDLRPGQNLEEPPITEPWSVIFGKPPYESPIIPVSLFEDGQ